MPLAVAIETLVPASCSAALSRQMLASRELGSVHGDGVNSLSERFGRADRKSQRAPRARSAGGVVIGESRQGGVATRNPN